MAFDTKQTKKAQAAIVIAALAVAVILLVVVLSGGLAPKSASSGAAGSATAATTTTGSASGAVTTTDSGSSSTSSTDTSGTAATSTSSSSQLSSVDEVNATYGKAEQQLQAQYDADQTNPSALLNLANGYFDWGTAVMNVAKTDADNQHVKDLFQKAIGLYDQYLTKNPGSKSVEVDRAISIFYTGDTDKAIQTLEAFVKADDSFGPAWANLGMFYEKAGRTDDAKAAYEKAIKADPSDTYQVKTYAQQRLDALNKNNG